MLVTDLLLALHLLGLMMGAGGGFGSMIVMRTAIAQPPERAAGLRAAGPALARFSALGLVVMVLTGFALVFIKYGGFAAMAPLFWVKIVFVISLSAAALAIESTYARVKRGDAAAAALLPALGPVAGVSSLLAMLFAVLAFH